MNKKSLLCELERPKEKLMAAEETESPVTRKRKYTARKGKNENTILRQDRRAKVDETTKRISRLRIQRNTRKEGKTLMKQLKRVSKMKIQSNITREGPILMKRLKGQSRLKIQKASEKKKKYKNGERKSI